MPKSESLDIGQLRRSYRKKKLTAVDILEAFGRGLIRLVKETVLIMTGGLILFCLVVVAMMVDIDFGRLVLLVLIFLGFASLARAIGRWFGGGR